MSHSNIIWLEQPAADWNEALPIGNGRLGAMVFGDVRHERLQLNEDTLWSGEPMAPPDPEIGQNLAEVRRLVFARQYAEATAACRKLQGTYTQSYQPLGDLWLDFGAWGRHGGGRLPARFGPGHGDGAGRYRIGDVTYHRYLFSSAPDQALVVRLTASQPGALRLPGVSDKSIAERDDERGPGRTAFDGPRPRACRAAVPPCRAGHRLR